MARNGDLLVIGRHRLLVGDARDERAFERLMQGETAAMAFLDPPTTSGSRTSVGAAGSNTASSRPPPAR